MKDGCEQVMTDALNLIEKNHNPDQPGILTGYISITRRVKIIDGDEVTAISMIADPRLSHDQVIGLLRYSTLQVEGRND